MVSIRISLSVLLLFLVSCATVPYTKRKQFVLMSEKEEIQLGTQAYQQVLAENKISTNTKWQNQLDTVGAKISAAADKPNFQWEFKVLQGKDVNAFALPGGKVAFWDGIMPVCENETGIAVVMGHEVAHALASHGAERMSQGMGAQIIGNILAVGLGGSDPNAQQSVLQAFGIVTQAGFMLPFSRKHESEADHIGLILMAKAGYDPHAAVNFWQRMAELKGGNAPPEFLSTHPSDETRIAKIKEWLPEALEYYRP